VAGEGGGVLQLGEVVEASDGPQFGGVEHAEEVDEGVVREGRQQEDEVSLAGCLGDPADPCEISEAGPAQDVEDGVLRNAGHALRAAVLRHLPA
jgi:hypothetical protein